MDSLLLFSGTALFVLGIAGALVRRSLLVALLSILVAALGGLCALLAFALTHDDAGGVARVVVLSFVAVVHALVGSSVAIAVFRRRGTLNLDELRELEG